MSINQPSCTDLLLRRDAPPFAFHPAIEPAFRAKIEAFLDEVRRRGYDELELAPPICRMLWQRGFALAPPIFLSLAQQVFLGAVCTGLLFGTGMTLFLGLAALFVGGLQALFVLPFLFLFSAVSFGGLFGMFYVARTRWVAWRMNLPAWQAFGAERVDCETTRAPALPTSPGLCPRCGNDPLACHAHQLVWCEKCAQDLRAMGDDGWRRLAHERDTTCSIAVTHGHLPVDYALVLPRADVE